jgi:hypothetical protein
MKEKLSSSHRQIEILEVIFYGGTLICGLIDLATWWLFYSGYGYGYGEVPRWAFASFMLLTGFLGFAFKKAKTE